MQSSIIADRPDHRGTSFRLRAAAEIALVFLVFFVQGATLAPDVNEPHYLGKASHYWDASWCADDFFCNSADAHQVFYWTFGWLSRVMSLEAIAWCGRLVTWALLAWAWRRLSWALVPGPFYAVLSASLLVTLVSQCHMAGEWLIGGFEAKGFAYVLVLLAMERLARGRWGAAVLLFGASASFHVIVGGWSVVAAAVVWLASSRRPPWFRMILPLAGGFLSALPGLLPAVSLTSGIDPPLVSEANRIYVYERLNHHLLPQRFPPWFIVRHLLLVGALVTLVWMARPLDDRFGRLLRFVGATVGIAAVGMAISLAVPWAPDFAAGLLRFYWFRMSDVMVPAGAALVASEILYRAQLSRPAWHAAALLTAMVLVGAHFGHLMWWRRHHPWPPADAHIANLADWREMCHWVSANTPPDAVFLTPRLAQTFRWYASRAEVVNRKDIPQDAPGIVEWWRRNQRIHGAETPAGRSRWRTSLAEGGARRLQLLGRQYGADYAITLARPPLPLERVGPWGGTYAIYRLDGDQRGDESSEAISPPAQH